MSAVIVKEYLSRAVTDVIAATKIPCMAVLLSGCSIPGVNNFGEVKEYTSEYDGIVRREVVPALVHNAKDGESFFMGIFHVGDSDHVSLIVKVDGVVNISSMGINIDGNLNEFESNQLTEHDINATDSFVWSWSEKRFVVSVDFLKRMVSAKRVVIQIRTNEGYLDGDFNKGCNSENDSWVVYACDAFNDFVVKHLKAEIVK